MPKTKVYEPEFKKKIVRLYLEEVNHSQVSRHIFVKKVEGAVI